MNMKASQDTFSSQRAIEDNTRLSKALPSMTNQGKTEIQTRVTFKAREHSENSHFQLNNYSTSRPFQTEANELRGLNHSAQTVRPQLQKSNTQNLEENVYKTKYLETLDQGNGFNKKTGYFTEYTRTNKILTDQYKLKKLPSNGHTRYISKPVFFTTLQSKNKLTQNISEDHSELLEISKQLSPQNSKTFYTPSSRLGNLGSLSPVAGQNDIQSPNLSPLLPTFSTKKTLERNPSQSLLKRRTYTPSASPLKGGRQTAQFSMRKAGEGEADFTRACHNFNTLSSITGGSDLDVLDEPDRSKKIQSFKQPATLDDIKSPKNVQDLTRYHTRQLTQVLVDKCAERYKVEPDRYMQQKNSVDYLRQTSFAISFKEKHRKSRAYEGTPQIDRVTQIDDKYKEPNTLEQIGKFEEGVAGWMKSVPNFGKQRWTYDKSWEFRII